MAKYIDADKLKKAFDQTSAREDGYYPNNVVDSIPAVDAVEVVRCRDCKHRPIFDPKAFLGPILEPKNGDGEWDCKCPFICSDPYYSSMPPDDHYCSYGARAENGSNAPDESQVCFNMI